MLGGYFLSINETSKGTFIPDGHRPRATPTLPIMFVHYTWKNPGVHVNQLRSLELNMAFVQSGIFQQLT